MKLFSYYPQTASCLEATKLLPLNFFSKHLWWGHRPIGKVLKPELDFDYLTLIGHSNGDDIIALFTQNHAALASKIITLDNRRTPLPRTKHPKVSSLCSSDQSPDNGVLPTTKEQKKFGITIIGLPHIIYNDRDDHANSIQRQEINNYIIRFKKNRILINSSAK